MIFTKKISLPEVSIKRELQIMLTILLLGVPNLINNYALLLFFNKRDFDQKKSKLQAKIIISYNL